MAIHYGQKTNDVIEGGYDNDFVDEVPSKYVCPICTKVLRKARLAECCGQHFCDSCLTQWTRRSPSCPHCRDSGFKSVINKEKIREINEFHVQCTHRTSGCEWQGQLCTLEEHLKSKSGCGFVKVKCGNVGRLPMNLPDVCHMVIERRYLAIHKHNECKYRRYKCKYCNYTDTYETIAGSGPSGNGTKNHYSTCEYYPLECVNGCGAVSIKRKDMKAHSDTCPLENTKCPFSGCTQSTLRKDMNSHTEICDFRPYTCEYCGINGTYLHITNKGRFWEVKTSHYDSCLKYPLECVNKCGSSNIKRKDMSAHQNTCPSQPLDCPLGRHSSGKQILRKDMEKHTREVCEFRPFTCQYCNTAGTFRSITGKGETPLKRKCHYDVCDHYPLECPNRCGAENIKRKNLPNHHSKCQLEPLDCPFKYVKCNEKILRKNMDSHCQKNMHNHLLLLAKSHEELTHKLAKSHEELSCKVVKSHEELTCEVKKLSTKCQRETRSDQVTNSGATATSGYTPDDDDPYYDDYYY